MAAMLWGRKYAMLLHDRRFLFFKGEHFWCFTLQNGVCETIKSMKGTSGIYGSRIKDNEVIIIIII